MRDDLKIQVDYEWCCEFVDEYDDILDTDYSDKLKEVWPPVYTESLKHTKGRLALKRDVGCEANGLQERGYAYKGDQYFCTGHKIPKHLYDQLNKYG